MIRRDPVPEIDAAELAALLGSDVAFTLLDIREMWELARARLADRRLAVVPLSQLAREGLLALPDRMRADPEARVVVFCHHGIRSAEVTAWLLGLGYTNAVSLHGGIDAYARRVDPAVGSY